MRRATARRGAVQPKTPAERFWSAYLLELTKALIEFCAGEVRCETGCRGAARRAARASRQALVGLLRTRPSGQAGVRVAAILGRMLGEIEAALADAGSQGGPAPAGRGRVRSGRGAGGTE